MRCEDAPVVRGVGHEEQDDVHAAVSNLQSEAPLEGLDIGEARLGLASRPASGEANERIPRPTITPERQRDLGVPACVGGESRSEPFEELQLRPIADGVTTRIEPCAELEPDGEPRAARLLQRQLLELATLDPAELRVRHPDRQSRNLLAHAGGHASFTEVVGDVATDLVREAACILVEG